MKKIVLLVLLLLGGLALLPLTVKYHLGLWNAGQTATQQRAVPVAQQR